ncbi:MAG: tRNA (adenosine(37)-N6)-threonylcarbamoyltransferase complex ATPase subunit type 1 TsaE [Candidatus Pacebacteria bacterium]|nr:tRNA (adenosine(37)-N6)-threonylcarbamoyltransferase complex ATPase subunit type 1 TsaE [Candidatus Paceibacterota bacterium]
MSITNSAQETQKLAGKILVDLKKNMPLNKALVLALQGNLGSGKTTFIQGVAKFLKIKGRITSPTFVILKRFRNFYHFDCYRLQKPEEILELGWEEIINNPNNIVAVEWPEKIKKFLPKQTVYLKFKFIDENHREIISTFKNTKEVKSEAR